MSERNALTSLWGRGGPNAMGMNDVKIANGSLAGKREQRILTPDCIIERMLRVWPHIALDPCGAPDSLVPAQRSACPDEGCGADYRDGLAIDWPRFTFVNPPYDKLESWLDHWAQFEEVAMLCPARPHRTWWRDRAFGSDAIVWLNSLKFVGFDQPFPAPLVMLYRGGSASAFIAAFSDLGDGCKPEGYAETAHQTRLRFS